MALTFVCLIVIMSLFFVWYFTSSYVKLELVLSLHETNFNANSGLDDFRSEIHWWFIDSNPNINIHRLGTVSPDSGKQANILSIESLKNWGIDFDKLGIDFNKNNVIITFSREIKEMKFKRADTFPFQSTSTVKTIMSKNFNPHSIYIYVIPKYDIREDLRAFTETTIEK